MANHKIRRLLSFVVSVFVFAGAMVFQAFAETSVKIRVFYDDIAWSSGSDILISSTTSSGATGSGALNRYSSTSTLTTAYGHLPVGQSINNDVTLIYNYDFWNGYNIDPNARYTFSFWFATANGVGRYITDMTVTCTLGNLTFTGQYGSLDGNGNRSCSISGSFLGSEFLKQASDGSTFTITSNVVDYPLSLEFGWWMDSFITLTVQSSTEQILDGLNSTFGEDYSQPDTSTFNQYEDLESEAMGQIQGGLDDITSQWNDLGGTLGQYQGAFLGVGSFFNKLTGIPWIGSVIVLSVAVGAFALLLGAVGRISSSYESNHSDSKKGKGD